MAKIIKRYQIGQVIGLNQEVIDAQKDITPPTVDATESKALKQQAFEQGFEQGKQVGLAEGMKKAHQKYHAERQTQGAQLQQMLSQIPQQVQTHYRQLSSQAVDLVAHLLPNFFVHHALKRSNIEHAVTQIIEQIDQQLSITVQISQHDYRLLQQQKITLPVKDNVTFTPSDHVQLGGCLIESEHGVFDGRLESQIDKLKQLLIHCKQQALSHE